MNSQILEAEEHHRYPLNSYRLTPFPYLHYPLNPYFLPPNPLVIDVVWHFG